MKTEKTKSPLVQRALKLASLPTEGLERPSKTADSLTEGHVRAVRAQHTEWNDLTVNDTTTGVLICSTVLDADIWLALREDFEPDPELPSFAVFYVHEIPSLKTKTVEQLKEIHRWKLTFGPGALVRQ